MGKKQKNEMVKSRKPWPPRGRLRTFTLDQAEFIKRMCPKHSNAELAELINEKYGLTIEPGQVKSFIKNHGIQSGRTGRFEKGDSPWNTGTKGAMKPNTGSFKKGGIPSNTRPVGSERFDKQYGYTYVKVCDNPHKWRMKHILVWEQHRGSVPPGHTVQFIDGDRGNITIENLELISKAVNVRRNAMGYSDLDPEVKPLVTAIAKIEEARQKRRKKKNEK